MPRQKSHEMYEVDHKSGKITIKKQQCPRCQGSYLAEHKNRRSCGHCSYSEYKR